MIDAGSLLRTALRAELPALARAGDRQALGFARLLIALIDNAEAVPPGTAPQDFHSGRAEAARRPLDPRRLDALIARELAELAEAATQFDAAGQPARAATARAQHAFITARRPPCPPPAIG